MFVGNMLTDNAFNIAAQSEQLRNAIIRLIVASKFVI